VQQGQCNVMSVYPRIHEIECDTMLARVLAVSVCLSVTSRCSIEWNEWINLVFGMEASFDQSYNVF